MVAKSLLVKILLRVILPLAVILVIVFSLGYFGLKQATGIGWFEGMRIEKDVKQVIAEFMEAGEARDIEEAYACKYYKSSFEEGIVELIERRYDDVFAGYKSLAINSMSWQSDMMLLGGGAFQRCRVKGDITYTSGRVLRFDARMVKENGIWKISVLRIGGHLIIEGNWREGKGSDF